MRKKSFKTYIKQYLKKVSLHRSTDIKICCEELEENPRLMEILFIYVSIYGKERKLQMFLPDSYKQNYLYFSICFQSENLEEQLEKLVKKELLINDPLYSYMKVYKSFLSDRDKNENKYKIKLENRESILELKQELKISDYRLCKDLNIDPGNFHAFFYKKKDNCLSYMKCDALFRYLNHKKNENVLKSNI